ncbi:MAG: S8 family serine peptidase [Synergistaceae bacterium]|nr:S8 family serine peptidase [Synergistaceae bacterium]
MFKNQIGPLNAASLSSTAGERYVSSLTSSVGAKTVTTYMSLSEAQGSIFTLVRSETKSAEELVAELEKNPNVICASPNYRVRALREPNDPRYGEQWGMKSIKADEAWNVTTGRDDIYVAVIDSGVYAEHEDLAANVDKTLSRNFVNPTGGSIPVSDQNFADGNGHGTHVTGTIASTGNNGVGVAGVNWNAKIIVLRTLDDEGSGFESWIIAALDYVLKLLKDNPDLRIPAINLSLGGWSPETPEKSQATAQWLAYQAIDSTNRSVIVVAAGNETHEVGAPAPYTIEDYGITRGDYCYPASFTGLNNFLVVGAVDERGEAPSFSSWSSKSVHLIAPGTQILSTYTPLVNKPVLYTVSSGTSMAAPHVSGAVALIASHRSDLKASQLKSLLCSTADAGINPQSSGTVGPYMIVPQNVPDRTLSKYGLLNVNAALTGEVPAIPVTGVTVIPASAFLSVGDILQLHAVLTPEDAANTSVVWSSSEVEIAAVTGTGLVTALSAGTTVIAAHALGGNGVSGSALISVKTSTPTPSPTVSPPTPTPVSPGPSQKSGGGCDAGFGIVLFASILGAAFLYKR